MNNEITYHIGGDYLIPDLFIVNHINENYQIRKYGRLRLKYLVEHKRTFYVELLLKGELLEHLILIDKNANKTLEHHINKLAKAEGIVLKEVIYW